VVSDKDEKLMGFEGFVRVTNNSGEEYEDAQVRLVVGTINLVEKIAQLARIPMSEVDKLEAGERKALRDQAAKESISRAEGPMGQASAPAQAQPKEIVKEGLSEYFIYTIEGTETIPNGWSKRMRSLEGKTVPFAIQYRYRPQEYGDQLVRMYLLTNNTDSKLGTSPLPDGVVRVFRDNGRDGLSFLAAQQVKYIPIGDKIEINLGQDPEVIFELIKRKFWRDNIWMQINVADVFRRVDDGAAGIEVNSSVAGWDDHAVYDQRIRNYTSKPIDVEIRRAFPGHVVFRSSLNPRQHDFQTVELKTSVNPAQKADLIFEVVTHQGRNGTQSNVKLEQAEVQP